MLKLMMMLPMILCLNSCRSPNTQIVCAQLEEHKIPPMKSCDVSIKFSRCRCRCFNYNAWTELPLKSCPEFTEEDRRDAVKVRRKKTGEVYEAVNFPLEHCDGISGSFLNRISTDVRPHVKALSQIKENLCD